MPPLQQGIKEPLIRKSIAMYLYAVITLVALCLISILCIIILRPGDPDNIVHITTIIGIVAPILFALNSAISADTNHAAQATQQSAYEAAEQAKETHAVVNSRMDEFKRLIEETARREVTEGFRKIFEQGRAAAVATEKTRVEEAQTAETIDADNIQKQNIGSSAPHPPSGNPRYSSTRMQEAAAAVAAAVAVAAAIEAEESAEETHRLTERTHAIVRGETEQAEGNRKK